MFKFQDFVTLFLIPLAIDLLPLPGVIFAAMETDHSKIIWWTYAGMAWGSFAACAIRYLITLVKNQGASD